MNVEQTLSACCRVTEAGLPDVPLSEYTRIERIGVSVLAKSTATSEGVLPYARDRSLAGCIVAAAVLEDSATPSFSTIEQQLWATGRTTLGQQWKRLAEAMHRMTTFSIEITLAKSDAELETAPSQHLVPFASFTLPSAQELARQNSERVPDASVDQLAVFTSGNGFQVELGRSFFALTKRVIASMDT